MSNSGDLFEMRRLEALSNTIFGVAMVLLAYRFPTAQFPSAPVWSTIWAAYHPQIIALVLSFVVAGMFWLGHQRRLAYAPLANRWVIYCNLLFLLSVVALPITTGLYATYMFDARDVVVLYCGHLAVMSCLNMILWLLASLPRGEPDRVAAATFATIIFIAATLVASISWQTYAVQLILLSALATPVIDAAVASRKK